MILNEDEYAVYVTDVDNYQRWYYILVWCENGQVCFCNEKGATLVGLPFHEWPSSWHRVDNCCMLPGHPCAICGVPIIEWDYLCPKCRDASP